MKIFKKHVDARGRHPKDVNSKGKDKKSKKKWRGRRKPPPRLPVRGSSRRRRNARAETRRLNRTRTRASFGDAGKDRRADGDARHAATRRRQEKASIFGEDEPTHDGFSGRKTYGERGGRRDGPS